MKIVVGYIRTPEGRAALERAIDEARLRNAHLIVVHSRRHADDRDVEDMIGFRDELDAIGARLREDGIPHTMHDYVRGNRPSEDILNAAREEEADLIVIGLRHRTPTGKYLLGSNSQDIILDAPCPVLSVKGPGAAVG